MGGLGNQLFQYAFMRHIQMQGFQEVYIDTNFYSDTPETPDTNVTARHFELSFLQTRYTAFDGGGYSPCSRIVYEAKGEYDPAVLQTNDVYLVGFWQDLKFCGDIFPFCREEFRLKPQYIDKMISDMEKEMTDSFSVSLHIRRTDYLNEDNRNLFAPCTMEYYEKAVRSIHRMTGETPVLFLFSDDMDYVKLHLSGFCGCKTVFVESGTSYQDLYLMSRAKHQIIANSTFSWWASVLNENNHITIAPKKWLW